MNNEPIQAAEVRATLAQAASHLEQAHAALKNAPPDYIAVLENSLQVIRLSIRAFLLWHGVPFDETIPIGVQVRHATQLASSLMTPTNLAPRLFELENVIPGKEKLSVSEREDVTTGFYTARNVLLTTMGELPENLAPPFDTSFLTNRQGRGGDYDSSRSDLPPSLTEVDQS